VSVNTSFLIFDSSVWPRDAQLGGGAGRAGDESLRPRSAVSIISFSWSIRFATSGNTRRGSLRSNRR